MKFPKFNPAKRIVEHPGVEECASGDAGGSDYKYDVLLKEGWVFKRGRMEGCQTGFFNNVTDFLYAQPMQKDGAL